jgi:hypothetical protein
MNIAIYNSINGHFEVIGYLLEIFKNHNITLFYNDNDIYQYVNYYEMLFGKIKKRNIKDFINKYIKYDKIYVITMSADLPNIFENIKSKTFGIIHASNRKSPYIENYITLYPSQMNNFKQKINDRSKNFNYTFPFYSVPNNIKFSEKKYILQIGALWDDDDDLKNFEKKINYEIIYFSRRKNKDIERDMFTMSKYLEKSIFILGRKTWHYPYAFSGSLSLSYSFNVPIILPEFKQKEYNLPCITFKENYSELINYINNINIDDYNKLLNDMNIIKKNEMEKNKKLLLSM